MQNPEMTGKMQREPRDLDHRLMKYSADIIRFSLKLPADVPSKIQSQLVSASTSVGANYQEAQGAESKADFVHKMQISLKEMRESYYWLQVISETKLASSTLVDPILFEAKQLRAILSKCVATAKGKNKV